MSRYLPPRGVGLPPQPGSKIGASYSNRNKMEERVGAGNGGDNEQGNSLDFISSLIKRDILSSPKTSSNHERSSQQALLDNRDKNRVNGRKSPLRMSQDMVNMANRNRILKPVNEKT